MGELDEIAKLTLSFDIRVESLAAYLLSNRVQTGEDLFASQIVIKPLGGDRRRTKPDTDNFRQRFYDADTTLQIEVNRKGLYDHLPERLFLRLDEGYENARKRTKAISQQRTEARKFLLPFDQAFYHPKIEIERKEQHYNQKFPSFIESLWGLDAFDDCLNDKQKFLLCFLFPQAHEVVGDWSFTGLVFEAVLRKPVNLAFIEPRKFESNTSHTSASELTLGENTIVGAHFKDDLPSLEIEIKGVTIQEINDYLEGGKTRRLIHELLCSYFLPLDMSYVLKINVTEDALGFDLDNCVLGLNTSLN